MFDLGGRTIAALEANFYQEIVLTGQFRIILLLVVLLVAGCSAKKAPGPEQAVPSVPQKTTQDAGETAGDQTATVEDADSYEPVPEEEDLSEAGPFTPEERTVLDSDISFPVGLDTEENKDVQRYFHYFAHSHRGTFEGWLKRAQLYLPHIRERFREEGLPEDLIYLPFVESGFNPFALSRAGACGVWQFMPQTGVNYGLTVDDWVDERRDPYKATEAAIKYLKKLHGDFGDWPLALAAYNAGEGRIGRAMEKTGRSDYISLCEASSDIKEETKLYVPKFLAIVKIARNLDKLGFKPIDWNKRQRQPVVYLQAKGGTNLLDLSKSVGLDWKTFRELNPVFRRQESPSRPVKIAIPTQYVAKAEDYLKRPIAPKPRTEYASYRVRPGDTWWAVAKKQGVSVADLQKANAKQALKVGASLRVPGKGAASAPLPAVAETSPKDVRKWASKRANYVVRQGDTLWSIAKSFKTDPATVLQANGMKQGATLAVGQKLFVPDAGSAATTAAAVKAEAAREELVKYQIRPGDTLWNIAKRFNVSPVELRKWNQLAENEALRPGERLKVYTR